ncbi:MAG: pilus assembly protein, partial [Paracoccaceae bacterium]
LYASLELGIITVRQVMLDRGLDMAVREVRLSTGQPPQHDDLKQRICDLAAIIPDCAANVKLEMRPTDMRNWQSIPDGADCTDRSEDIRPLRQFTAGLDNEMMLLRACVKFSPLSPTSRLVASMGTDAAGDIKIVSLSAFVQEPR